MNTSALNRKSVELANSLGGLNTNPNPADKYHNDAFRHAYASALFSQNYNPAIAKLLGDFNEKKDPSSDPTEAMQEAAEKHRCGMQHLRI